MAEILLAGVPAAMFWPYPPPPGDLSYISMSLIDIPELHEGLQVVSPDAGLGGLLSVFGKGVIPGEIIGGVVGAVNVVMLKDKGLVGVACGIKIVDIASWGAARAGVGARV